MWKVCQRWIILEILVRWIWFRAEVGIVLIRLEGLSAVAHTICIEPIMQDASVFFSCAESQFKEFLTRKTFAVMELIERVFPRSCIASIALIAFIEMHRLGRRTIESVWTSFSFNGSQGFDRSALILRWMDRNDNLESFRHKFCAFLHFRHIFRATRSLIQSNTLISLSATVFCESETTNGAFSTGAEVVKFKETEKTGSCVHPDHPECCHWPTDRPTHQSNDRPNWQKHAVCPHC